MTCLLVSLDSVFEANHGSCATMISWALVLPDLMTFLMAVPSLMIGLPCLLAALMHVTGSVDVSLNALDLGDCGMLEGCAIRLVIGTR